MKEFIEKLEGNIETLCQLAIAGGKNGQDAKDYTDAAFTVSKIYSIMIAVQQTRAMNVPFNIKKEKVGGGPSKN